MLPYQLRNTWESKIKIFDQGFFERKWTYLEQVVVVGEQIHFSFNPSTKTPGPFKVRFEYSEHEDQKPRVWEGINQSLNKQFVMTVPNSESGLATLYLDESLAYQDWLVFGDIPF